MTFSGVSMTRSVEMRRGGADAESLEIMLDSIHGRFAACHRGWRRSDHDARSSHNPGQLWRPCTTSGIHDSPAGLVAAIRGSGDLLRNRLRNASKPVPVAADLLLV